MWREEEGAKKTVEDSKKSKGDKEKDKDTPDGEGKAQGNGGKPDNGKADEKDTESRSSGAANGAADMDTTTPTNGSTEK